MPIYKNVFSVLLILPFLFCNCRHKAKHYESPAGYDTNKPEKFILNNALKEISGICFLAGKKDTLFAIEDEDGKLYSFVAGNDQISHSKFGKKGDFEDVTILNDSIVAVLKSEGSILLFPAGEIGKEKIDSVQQYNNILPEGEYEGLFATDNKLFVLCKNCLGDNEKTEVSLYTISYIKKDSLAVSNTFKIDLSMIEIKKGKTKFHPSAISKNPVTKEWFIISSVNKLLIVLDEQWKVKAYFPLDPALFNQPEGLAFNATGDMYISNEGGEGVATILVFPYKN